MEYDDERKYVVLVIYDISSNKQRVKVAKYLNSYGIRVQKSAFEARLGRKKYQQMIDGLKKLLEPDDSIRIYKLYGYEEIVTLGKNNYLEEQEDVVII